MLAWIVIRVIGTVPINKCDAHLEGRSTPKDWREPVDHAERFHVIGVWVAVMSFAFFLISAALKLAIR